MARNWNISGITADLYVGRSGLFKVFLLGGVVVISAIFIWYTFVVIEQLQQDTRDQVEKYVKLWQLAANSQSSGDELQFIFDEIIVKARFPIVVLDRQKNPVSWRNIPDIPSDDTTQAALDKVTKVANEMYHEHQEFPLYFGETNVNYLRYGDSEVITQLRTMPFIAVGIVLGFVVVTMIGFHNIRRSEERYIWVGMAKETAHQLGTPLSSLLGWLEMIGYEQCRDLDTEEKGKLVDTTVENMRTDVDRLQRVANRFSQIGSRPELQECNMNSLVAEAVEYYKKRLPFEGQGTKLVVRDGDIPPVRVNSELFTWVLENLVKNALQAVDPRVGVVTIATSLSPDGRRVYLEVHDNGRGVAPGAARKLFRPGFTTKKRGWGMGLTLVKRIVEEYHDGRVWLDHSSPGDTLFRISLPVSGGKRI